MIRVLFSAVFSMSLFSASAQLSFKGHAYAPQAATSVHSNSGKFLYIGEKDAIAVHSVNQSNGSLKLVQRMKTQFGGEVSSPYLSADNRFLYGTLGKKHNGKMIRTIVMYSVDKRTGKLKFLKNFENDTEFQYDFVSNFHVSPNRDFMFFGKDESNSLAVYKLDPSTGIPKFLNAYDTEIVQHFGEFRMSPDQRFIYVGGGNSHKQVVVYSFNQSTGALSKIQEVEQIGHWASSSDLVVSADGKHLYQPNGLDGEEIIQFNRDQNTGMLTYQNTFEFKAKGGKMHINFFFGDRNTDFLYGLKSFGDGDAIHVVERDPNTGSLNYRQSLYDVGSTNRLNGVFQMSFSKNNKYAYASGMWDNALNIFHTPETRETIDFKPNTISDDVNDTNSGNDFEVGTDNSLVNTNVSSCNGDALSNQEFRAIYGKLASEETDISRLNRSFELLEGKCIKVVQASGLAYLFDSEYQRLQFVKFISYFLSDAENKHMLADLFQYENMRDEVRNL